MFLGLPRRGARAVLPALFTFTAACVLSVSSAQAAVATWADFSANPSIAANGDFTSPSLTVGGAANHVGGVGSLAFTDFSTLDNNTLTFSLTASGDLSLATLDYTYSSALAGTATIDWTLQNGVATPVDLGTTGISAASTDIINLTLNGSNPNGTLGTVFTLVGTLSGTVNSDNITFNQFSITAVPEPVNYALAGFGLIFVGVGAGRFYLGRRRSATAS